ncbi:hypothetical protein [Nonomuraea polychroma]|uniref:hypothetical protein n=1 Tax=Nonomuraea polychroma TaxID=46176 RepID=UPI000FDDE892|nr:hypothetical protein [Nonomuraea polychroma]
MTTDTGAKLSRSLIRDGKMPPPGTRDWMLDITSRPGDTDSFVDAMDGRSAGCWPTPSTSTAASPPRNWIAS